VIEKKQVSRRTIVKLGALLSSFSFIPTDLLGLDFIELKTGFQNEDIYHFKVGKFKCTCIRDSDVTYPIENFFKGVPKELVEEALRNLGAPTDLVHTPLTHLIVDTGKNKILVDTGLGRNLASNMKIAGIDPSEIDSVFITHAHPDHVGGILDDKGNPIYTNAHYYVWKGEWDFWFSPTAHEIAKDSQIKTAREKLGPVKERVILLEKDLEIFKGIKVIAAPGHTPGHVIYSFNSKNDILYYTGDVVLFPIHLEHPDWLPIYDLVPEKALISKNKIFDMIAETKARMVGQQFFPFPSLGQIIKKEIGWKFVPTSEA
jgi:glyoxylase-like metal-dependent hydrolase (beta-lactamase superfamily II)